MSALCPSRCIAALAFGLGLSACASAPAELTPTEGGAGGTPVIVEADRGAALVETEDPDARSMRVLESNSTRLRVIVDQRIGVEVELGLSGPSTDPQIELRTVLRSYLRRKNLRISRSGGLSLAYEWTTASGIVLRESQDCSRPRPDDLQLGPGEADEHSWSRDLGPYERLELRIGLCPFGETKPHEGGELALVEVELGPNSTRAELHLLGDEL